MPSTHEPRLSIELRQLIDTQCVAALGTVDANNLPFVSMVPYVREPETAALIIHVSALAAHTSNLQARPQVSLLITQTPFAASEVHALPRVSLNVVAAVLAANTPEHASAKSRYLQRFPQAEPMTQLGDFMFVSLRMVQARQIAGFGAARTLDEEEIQALMGKEPKAN